jgi:peptidoglycan L-alanyl-D-glutamate endopeptidase CwlK
MVTALLEEANRAYERGELPHRVEIAQAYRSQEEQDELRRRGVTPAKRSQHTERLAVDLAARDERGRLFYPKNEKAFYGSLAAIAKRLGFQWGGDFRVYDPGHFQYPQRGYQPRPSREQQVATIAPAPTAPAPAPPKPKPSTTQEIVNRQYPALMRALMASAK